METAATGLDAYFARIGFSGPAAPDLETLRRLHLLHPQAIPFENLSPFLGLEVLLETRDLFDKMVRQGRGGYCYEHNLLFRHVLDTLGYRTTGLAARVRMNVADDVQTARSHMLLLIELEGMRYIADTGFGGMTLTAPLLLAPDIVQDTPHGEFRLLESGGNYQLQARQEQQWLTLYAFDLQPQLGVDYAVSSWYLCHYPHSSFVTGLMCARPAPDGRHALRNQRYTFYRSDGGQERIAFRAGEGEALRALLVQKFGIRMPALPDLDHKLDAFLQRCASV